MNPTTIQILNATSLCLTLAILIFCLAPAVRSGVMHLKSKQTKSVTGSFHKEVRKLSSYNNEILIEIDGAIMGDAKISNDLLDTAIDEMTSILANEDTKWGRCLAQESSVLDINGVPSPAITWILESTESPVIWRGQTDQNGSVVEVYKLDETETQMRFATTKNNEALQAPTNYVYHQS